MTPVTIPAEAGQPALEGVWLGEGERIAVIAPPHPLMGGELSNPVVQALAMGLGAAGTRSLLFNWRGVGESNGVPSGDPDDAERDYLAVLDLAARAGAEIVAAGYSFGAATAIRVGARDARVRTVFAVAPPPPLVGSGDLTRLGGRCVVVGAEGDAFAPAEELAALTRNMGGSFELLRDTDHFFGQALGRLSEIARDAIFSESPLSRRSV